VLVIAKNMHPFTGKRYGRNNFWNQTVDMRVKLE